MVIIKFVAYTLELNKHISPNSRKYFNFRNSFQLNKLPLLKIPIQLNLQSNYPLTFSALTLLAMQIYDFEMPFNLPFINMTFSFPLSLSLLYIISAEYYDNNHCHPCHSTCETCDGPTESNCLSCPQSLLLQNNHCVSTCDDGYYMEAGVCAKCLHTCTQCVSRMNCTACAKGLQLQSGECRTTCADG